MKKNDRVKAICENYTHEGYGVVKVNGFPLFVKDMLQGEEAEIVVTMVKKTYGYAKVIKFFQQSAQRVKPMCALAQTCGGCQLQHMSMKEQQYFKHQKVQEVIHRIAKLDIAVEDVLTMKHPSAYRNKGQIPVGFASGHVVCGFYRVHSNTIIDMQTCPIQSDAINNVLQCVRKLFKKYPDVVKFMRHILIKHAFVTGQIMVVFITKRKDIAHLPFLIQDLVQEISNIESVIQNVNTREDNVVLGDKEYVLYGERTITDKIHDLAFHISSKSFYQVNPIQTEVLYGKVLEFAQLSGEEMVLDLYCGVGTISMFLAQQAKQVIGIEIVPQAIQDAKINAELNGLKNIDFICSDAADYAAKVCAENLHPDIIVVDPPRKGCDGITLQSIVTMQPKKIIYVSCDPATLARDLRILTDDGYHVEVIQPVDMFPQTFHVESVVLISKK